jgi:predicted amidohydrolase YtcJ
MAKQPAARIISYVYQPPRRVVCFGEFTMARSIAMPVLLGVALAASHPAIADPPGRREPANLVFRNGKIWTGEKDQPGAMDLMVASGRLAAARGEAKEFMSIDLKGCLVVPGFFDSHVHLLGSGLRLSEVALKDAKDEADFGMRLREFDQKLPRDRWMLGGEWDHDRALNGELPTAALIDKYVPDRPVFLRRYDGHMGVVNSKVLQMAGITAKTADPTGGVIFRDKDGNPTGVLRDNAMGLVERLIPRPDDAEIAEAVKAALAELAKNGVTSVVDMDGSDPATRRKLFKLYQRMAREGTLTCRIDLRWPLSAWQELANLGVEARFGDEWVTIGGLKGFADGSLGSSTAKMFEPFVNEPNSTGVFVTPPAVMRQWVLAADKAGLAVCVHAIGDQANAQMLDIFAEVAKLNGPRDRRFRIEHAQHLRPEDFQRFKELGVIPSLQPYHVIDDGRWAEGRIGAKRCASSYANRSLLDAGAKLAFGSDWSVAPVSAILGIDAAVNRRTLDGKHPEGWFPKQKITVKDALEAYTTGSAYAAFQEKDRGMLKPGMLADFVVLSRDILDPKERDHIDKTEVLMTAVGGKIVYEKK